MTTIGVKAFYRCKALLSLAIPGSVSLIGSNAFKGCRGLREVTVPEGAAVLSGCTPSGTVSVPAGDTVWREATAAAGGVVVEDVAFRSEAELSMAQKAYCLAAVEAGETAVQVVGDAATVSACDALGVAPTRTVGASLARSGAETVTLTFAEPTVEVVSCDFAARTLTVRVTPGEGTSRASAFLPSRFVAEGGPSLAEISQQRVLAVSTAETEAEATAEERAYVSSGLVTFALPEPSKGERAMFWRAAVR